MNLLPLAFLFLSLSLLPFLAAAPTPSVSVSFTDSDSQQDGTAGSANPSSVPRETTTTPQTERTTPETSTSTTVNQTHKPTVGTTKHRVVVTTTTQAQITLRSGNPTRTNANPAPSQSFHHPHPHSRPIAALVLEILGALAGFIFVLSLLRCLYSYNRTPSRDRISIILHRHQLQREMEELERNPPGRRRSLVEPPPPYVAPPVYPAGEDTPLSQNHSYIQETHGQLSPLRPNG
ncbi:hypothetical protein DFH09DRAFT_1177145 [Mycena vulgaris]|nr:hypothetical protein DFH09DRAFT_1177145 [Mycena vulgaris]